MTLSIDKREFERLFSDVGENRAAILETLYRLAGMVVQNVAVNKKVDFGDVEHLIYLHLQDCVEKYDPARGNAYGYFWKVAVREAWKVVAKEEAARSLGDDVADLDDDHRLVFPRDKQPITTKTLKASLPKSEVKAPLKLLDRIIRKAKDKYRTVEETTPELTHLLGGIAYLQQYRYSLVNEYYPCRIGSVNYSADRVTTQER